jgi:hypothetical protein
MSAILPSGSLRELGVLLHAVNLLHGSNSLKSLPKDFVPKFFRPEKLNPRHSGHEVGTLPLDHGGRSSTMALVHSLVSEVR